MGVTRSKLPYFVFCGGITGTAIAFTLQTITQTNFWASIGLTLRRAGEEPSRRILLGRADLALADAKRAGGNCCSMRLA